MSDREALVTLLVDMPHTTGVIVSMVPHRVRSTYPSHEAAHFVIDSRTRHKVIVIGHPLERKQLTLVHLKSLKKDPLESLEVLFFVKDGCPKVASVQGVVKPSGFVGTWWSGPMRVPGGVSRSVRVASVTWYFCATLGFTHKCGKTRTTGSFTVQRHSVAKRLRTTLQAIKQKLRKRRHRPLGETAGWLRRVVQGCLNYHAVPGNSHRIGPFMDEVARPWLSVLRRRSQRGRSRWTRQRLHRLVSRHLPRPRILHPYPDQQFRVRLKAGTA